MSEPKIETEWLWCNTCKKTFPAYLIKFRETKWAFVNPHEHALTVGICPRTAWLTLDFKEDKFPQLTELFKLCEEHEKLNCLLKVFEELAEIEKRR